MRLAPSDLESNFDAIAVAQTEVDRCFHVASVQSGSFRPSYGDFANSVDLLDIHAKLKRTLDGFQAPLARWSDGLTKITDQLDSRLRLLRPSHPPNF